ncbi:unnamed protein product, partial [Closterium sp. Naga37s-1]
GRATPSGPPFYLSPQLTLSLSLHLPLPSSPPFPLHLPLHLTPFVFQPSSMLPPLLPSLCLLFFLPLCLLSSLLSLMSSLPSPSIALHLLSHVAASCGMSSHGETIC